MTKFESKRIIINAPCEKVYDFMADFNNFEKLLPDRVSNWQATSDSCSFKIEGIGNLAMRIESKTPCSQIHIVSDGDNPVNYSLDCFFYKYEKEQCETEIVFDAELSAFMQMVASKPLQNFVNMLVDKLKELFEQ